MTVNYGIEAGDQALTTGERWPRLRMQDGDRVRYHFLTTGSDPWLVATKFHKIQTEERWRDVVCLSSLTQGVENCTYCEIDTNRRNMFACWIWVEYILHPHDNPDEEGDSWEQKQLKAVDGGKPRTVFMEPVGGKPLLLWLPAGRQKVWWSQFTSAWMSSGDLRKHLYELHRVGAGRDDTNYTLTAIKEEPLAEDVLNNEEVKNLPSIEEVFRDGLRFAPTASVLGSDGLDEGPPADMEPLPSVSNQKMSDDDLI